MIYLTFGDKYSGVYEGQVIDVCKFLEKIHDVEVKLIAFISLRNFFTERRRIKTNYSNSFIVPHFPRSLGWIINLPVLLVLALFLKKKRVICRGIFAANLSLKLRDIGLLDKVIYDGRSASAAEQQEYGLNKNYKEKKYHLEKNAVLKSSNRIAVSSRLVEYWQKEFKYKGTKYTIIPCMVRDSFNFDLLSDKEIKKMREELGFRLEDVILVYAGSTAVWQSFEMLKSFLESLLVEKNEVKVLFLSRSSPQIQSLIHEFPNQVVQKWVKASDVPVYLMACDYGLLIREESTTNKVAAPVKFGEYLASGLSVIISESVGDYTDFVRGSKCGLVIGNGRDIDINLEKLNRRKKQANIKLAYVNFTKHYYVNKMKYHSIFS